MCEAPAGVWVVTRSTNSGGGATIGVHLDQDSAEAHARALRRRHSPRSSTFTVTPMPVLLAAPVMGQRWSAEVVLSADGHDWERGEPKSRWVDGPEALAAPGMTVKRRRDGGCRLFFDAASRQALDAAVVAELVVRGLAQPLPARVPPA